MQEWLTPSLVLSLAAFGLAVVNSLYTRKKDSKQEVEAVKKELEGEIEAFEDHVAEIRADLKVLQKQVDLFWKTVEQQMSKRFKEPD
jgi:septal ring factor EnvC (AmiA/AmiB activator)